MNATPLEKFSSLNEISFAELSGVSFLDKHFFIQFSFNLQTPLTIHKLAYLTFEMRDAKELPSCEKCCYSITDIIRWRLPIEKYKSMESFLKDCKSKQRNQYRKSKKTFFEYGCRTEYQESDWSTLAPQAYKLYCNIAKKHGTKLYDLSFFMKCAKREDYALLTAWFNGEMIAMTVLQKEHKTLHSICGGFDYVHSSPCYAYSWLNYTFIELAIAGHYSEVDAGITADVAKSNIGYHPVPTRIDIYSKGFFTRSLLSAIAPLIKTSLDVSGKLTRA